MTWPCLGAAWVLILDEINRTDVSRLFGELFSLLEDRNETIDLPALDEGLDTRSVAMPADLFFIGTMNLIDQSVEQLDFALRRRFLWLPTGFEKDVIAPVVEQKWEDLGESEDTKLRVRHNPWERFRDEIDVLAERAADLNREIAESNWSVLTNGKRGYANHPETNRWRGRLVALYARHEAEVEEMCRRGFTHHSPLELDLATGESRQPDPIDPIAVQRRRLAGRGCGCLPAG